MRCGAHLCPVKSMMPSRFRRARGVATRQFLSAVAAVTAFSACSGGGDRKTTITRLTEPVIASVALTVAGSGSGSGRVTSTPAGIECAVSSGAASGICSARFTPGTLVTLETLPGATSVFLAFGGDCALSSCQTTMEAPRTVTATFVPNVLAVLANAASIGTGRIVSTPAGIDCMLNGTAPGTGSCSASFPGGTAVSLAQDAAAGAVFQAWGTSCIGDPCTVTMNGQRTVDATFRLPLVPSPAPTPPSAPTPPADVPAMLTVSPSPTSRGSGTITSLPAGINCLVADGSTSGVCSLAFPMNSAVTLSQVARGISILQGWSGDCIGNPCQMSLARPRVAEITYRLPPPGIVTVSGVGTGTGAVTSSPSGISCTVTAGVTSGICSAAFEVGGTVTFVAGGTANASFDGFSGACTGGSCAVAVASSMTSVVTAAFTAAPQRLTVTAGAGSAGGGVITSTPIGISCVLAGSATSGTCTALFAANTVVTMQPVSSGNARFASWTGDCVADPCQVVMSQPRTALASFHTQGLTISGGGSGHGVVTSVPTGISCTVTAGLVGGICAATFPPNTVVVLTATPSGLSSFSGYTGACAGNTCTTSVLPGITGTVTAQFTAPPTLTLGAGTGSEGGGTLTSSPSGLSCTLSWTSATGSCSTAYALGTNITVTQTPAGGSVFLNWAGACTGGGSCQVTMSQVRAVQALYRRAVPGAVTVATGSGTGNGSVSSSPGGVACSITGGVRSGICRAIFPVGSTVTLLAIPASGHTFTGFTGSCTGMTCTLTVPENGDITVAANFTR